MCVCLCFASARLRQRGLAPAKLDDIPSSHQLYSLMFRSVPLPAVGQRDPAVALVAPNTLHDSVLQQATGRRNPMSWVPGSSMAPPRAATAVDRVRTPECCSLGLWGGGGGVKTCTGVPACHPCEVGFVCI